MSPYFSIIVPVFNAIKTLDGCIQSILSQGFFDIELILVDDGSVDGSGPLCDAWTGKDDRVQVIHKANGGVSSARNAGLAAAAGRYIGFVDSDDTVKAGWLQTVYTRNQGLDADIISFGMEMCQDSAVYQSTVLADFYAGSKDDFKQYFDEYYRKLMGAVWNKIYSADIIEGENIRFDEGMKIYEDAVFDFLMIPAADKFLNIGTVFYTYCQIEQSLSRRARKDILEASRRKIEMLSKMLRVMAIDVQQSEAYCEGAMAQAVYTHYLQAVRPHGGFGVWERRALLREIYTNKGYRRLLIRQMEAEPASFKTWMGLMSARLRCPLLVVLPASLYAVGKQG